MFAFLKVQQQRQPETSAGFSLIEVMMGVALLSLVILASAAMTGWSSQVAASASRKAQAEAIGKLVSSTLSFDNSCAGAIGAASPTVQNSGLLATRIQQSGAAPAGSNGWEFQIYLNGINSGAAMTGTVIGSAAVAPDNYQILPVRLQVDSLRLADATLLNSGVTDKYVANIYMKLSEVGGVSFKGEMLGSLVLISDHATGVIQSCKSASAPDFSAACTGMGCTYNSAAAVPCQCPRNQVICAAPGYYAVGFTADGLPDCRPAGGSSCPTGEYLAGFGIDYVECVKDPNGGTPTPTPAPTPTPSPTPAGCVPGPGHCCIQESGPPLSWTVNTGSGPNTCHRDDGIHTAANRLSIPTGPITFDSNICAYSWSGSGCHGTLNANCNAAGALIYLSGTTCDDGVWP
jgi:prepilin-type N-terminal cleavage/methylation domain-containing protein